MNKRVTNSDEYPATSRYRNTQYYKRDIRTGVIRVEPSTWAPTEIPEEALVRMTEVRPGEAGALDLISYRVYGTDRLWWVIGFANDIVDPFDEVVVGLELKYPTFSYVTANILA